ncbi:PREDICTED: uncharacterized protein LOC108612735 [Drosophila arizonae]|uniref:Uncharacterized protein LOC108612735 n=1 Tax=Drosophila arizonae TaxID=7263 RepID=A0ABM1P1W4_DROAR|nr:PREDICTED: uncharacterized protein LOC108612735 [Drosophila arizonae]
MALSAAWSCALALLAMLCALPAATQADYPGVIELVGYSNRRARTHFMESPSYPTLAPPASKTRADIETVKRNMKKYDRLLELDTKDLPEPQKDMLARIVERVARLKETLDIEEQQLIQQEATSARSSSGSTNSNNSSSTSSTQPLSTEEAEGSTLPTTGYTEAETDPTLLLDETTLLELQNTMNEQAALQAEVTAQTMLMKELPTTTDVSETTATTLGNSAEETQSTEQLEQEQEEMELEQSTTSGDALTDATDPDDQFVAARSNNNIAAITAADPEPNTSTTSSAGNQRTLSTMGKHKIRPTKRPFGHKVAAALKRNPQQRPGSVSAAAANAAAQSKPPTNTGNKKQTGSTSSYQKLSTKPQQQKVTPAGSTHPATMTTANSPAPALPIEQLYTRTPQANIPLAAASSSSAAAAAAAAAAASSTSSSSSDAMVYDAHVNASALIDSLNTHAREEYYQQKLNSNSNNNNKDNKKTATAKPTKYHYYPHNQHIYLLPECAIQQVCNAVYVRLNYTQPLCACPSRYRDPCSASLNEDDQHTTKLVGDNKKKAITLAKTCEATTEMRECRSPKDWSLLALQNTRTGKSHYLVICRCPDHFKMEGPMAHDQPTYASVPGIRVFGMMCVKPGYSVRKPSVQPPKRYQLQKPFYRPGGSSSNNGGNIMGGQKDSYGRPIYGGLSGGQVGSSAISANYQPQDQTFQNGGGSSYQYLNRPESTQHTHSSAANFRPDQFSLNGFPGSNYGRNNERRGEAPPIEAAAEERDQMPSGSSSTQSSDEAEGRTTLQAEQSDATTAELTTQPEPTSRVKRSLDALDDYEPEFPWDRVLEFQQSIVWD